MDGRRSEMNYPIINKQSIQTITMRKEHTDRQTDPMKVIFNYNDVFFSFFYDDTESCTHRSHEYAMNYVYSGEMVLDNGSEKGPATVNAIVASF